MEIIRSVDELEKAISEARKKGLTVGLVPTMGALHAGHISLIDRAVKENDLTVVSVFVNPTQFNNPTDLATYPRTEKDDVEKLQDAGVNIAFIPEVNEVYPEPDTRVFDLGAVATVMEGAMRPGHFNGVAQIVSKLFHWTKPDRAYFGEKDFQQIAVIKRLVELEKSPVKIVECPINREEDGLARSSRNVRLTEKQRTVAPDIYSTLKKSLDWKKEGMSPRNVEKAVCEELAKVPYMKPEYYAIVDSLTLQPLESWEALSSPEAYPVGCIAIFCGDVRLIDNIKYQG